MTHALRTDINTGSQPTRFDSDIFVDFPYENIALQVAKQQWGFSSIEELSQTGYSWIHELSDHTGTRHRVRLRMDRGVERAGSQPDSQTLCQGRRTYVA